MIYDDDRRDDEEYDFTAEEAPAPLMGGSRVYTDDEWRAIEDYYYTDTMDWRRFE